MKIKFTYLFIFAVLFLMACQPKSDTSKSSTADTIAVVIPDSVKVPYVIAKHYVTNYAAHAGFVDPNTGEKGASTVKNNTRCIWFSKERLTQMLQQLEKEDGDGVRFYLMTYDDQYNTKDRIGSYPPPEPDYWGYNSLLMVSTRDSVANGQTYHRDYYTDQNMLTGAQRKNKPGFIVGMVPENRGELCPPPSDCFRHGALLLEN
jgi:hypothetical protein